MVKLMSQVSNKDQRSHEEVNKYKVIAPGRSKISFVWFDASFDMILCLSATIQKLLSPQSDVSAFREFFAVCSAPNHLQRRSIRKSPERAFQRYTTLSKLTSGLKFIPK